MSNLEHARIEDGCVIGDEFQVEWRDNSAVAYCVGDGAECYGRIDQPNGGGHKGALIAAKMHTLSTGHRTKVESTEHFIVEVEKATS